MALRFHKPHFPAIIIKMKRFVHGFFFIIILAGCTETVPVRFESMLGTACVITLYENGKPQVYNDIFNRLLEIESRMSVHINGTEIDTVNAAAGIRPVKVSADFFGVMESALFYAAISDGAFDPTVGPLTALWDIGGKNQKIPLQHEIDEVLLLVNFNDVELDRANSTVFLRQEGMALDLGAIAKGYAADEAAAIIKNAGIPRAIIDLGGNILVLGEKKDKTLWSVGVQDPYDSRGVYLGIIQVPEKTVVTSGVYERFFEADGISYHHIFSPFDGYPMQNDLLSVTIITDSSMTADALSTAVFVMGYEKGKALIESLEGVAAIFVFNDKSIRITGEVNFNLTNNDFRITRD